MTTALAAALAAYGLPSRRSLPDRPLSADHWERVLGEARDDRTIGLLSQAIAEGSFAATPEQAEAAYDVHAEAMGLAVVLERVMLDVVDLLNGAGIDHRVLKGSAVAHLVYPDPSLRPFGDVDLLVPAHHVDRAVATLVDAGYLRERPQLRPGFDRRFAKSVSFTSPHGLPVDLHRTLAAGRFGLTLAADDLFDSSAVLVLAGRRLAALAADERFLHACYHAALGSSVPPVLALRDIAQMLLTSDVDLTGVQRRCQAWRGQAVLARAVVLAWETLALADSVPLVVWARSYQPSASERWVLRAHTVQRSGGTQALTALAAIRGNQDKVAFLWAMVAPQRAFLGEGRARYWRWWGRGASALARSKRG
ncbi:MAG: nucleotidyltransferase family protein [Acidimicrobiia bacterium]|jgi:hypothetical protein|nr:nucleotidyltransferase family protein [Acidimicrobiia bacterium]